MNQIGGTMGDRADYRCPNPRCESWGNCANPRHRDEMMTGAERIARERRRQVEEEGWDPEHDDGHQSGSLALAAACYAVGPSRVHVRRQVNSSRGIDPSTYQYDYTKPGPGEIPWPWDSKWWKPSENRVRDLEKAGALIAAEIDRLTRTPPDSESESNP